MQDLGIGVMRVSFVCKCPFYSEFVKNYSALSALLFPRMLGLVNSSGRKNADKDYYLSGHEDDTLLTFLSVISEAGMPKYSILRRRLPYFTEALEFYTNQSHRRETRTV